LNKRLKKKRSKPPPTETQGIVVVPAEDFLESGVDSYFVRMKSENENDCIYTIRKDGEKEGTLCRIDRIVNWSIDKLTGVPPKTGVYKVRKNGRRITLSKFRLR